MIIASNFKTNKTRQATREYYAQVSVYMQEHKITQKAMIFPPATALDTFDGPIVVGAQNAYNVSNGAFTGEIGLEQLEEFGINMILIGHSERRHILGESQEQMAERFAFFKEQGFHIVYCIGEPLEIREAGSSDLMAYLDAQCEDIDLTYDKLVVAYEPVWAIGTGLTPTENEVEAIHRALRQKTTRPLLYGGSVKVANAQGILALENVDGALIGSGALNADDFCEILEIAQKLEA